MKLIERRINGRGNDLHFPAKVPIERRLGNANSIGNASHCYTLYPLFRDKAKYGLHNLLLAFG
jgi:hypothetical protein